MSYYASIFLHCFVLFCIVLFSFVSSFFEEEQIKDEKFVFEMQEAPPRALQSLEEASLPENEDFIEKNKIKEAKALELPEPPPAPKPAPKPAPSPEPKPAPKPAPSPEPKPEPKPKAAPKPKPEAKPEPKPVVKKEEPKKISFSDFQKKNPTKAQPKPVQAKKVGIKVDAITYDGKNLSKIEAANIGASSQSGLALKNAIQAYLQSVNSMARAKWTLPSACLGMSLSVDIAFNISSKGLVSSIRILRSSGNSTFDNSVISVFSRLKLSSPPNNKAIENVSLSFESN